MNYTKQKKNLFEEEENSAVKNVATKFMQGVATSNLPGMAGKAVASQIGSASKELYSPKASSSTKAASSADKASSGMSTLLSPTKTNSSVGSASQSSASGSLGSLYKNSGTASKSKQTASERLKEAFSSTKPNPYTPQSSEKYKSSSEIVKKTKNKFDIDPTLNEIKASYDKAKKASGYEQKSRIQSLQNNLNKYGVRDSEENPLKEDGIFGEKTRSAFESLYEKPTAAKNAKYDMKLKELRRQGEKVSTQHKPYKASHQQGLDFVYDVVNLQKNLNKAGIYDDEANTLEVDGIFGDRTKSALTKLSTTKAEDLYPANRITNHNRELISRALDISSRITDTLYPSIPLGLVQRQLNEAGFRDVNGELLVEDGIFGEQMEGALRGYGEESGDGFDFSADNKDIWANYNRGDELWKKYEDGFYEGEKVIADLTEKVNSLLVVDSSTSLDKMNPRFLNKFAKEINDIDNLLRLNNSPLSPYKDLLPIVIENKTKILQNDFTREEIRTRIHDVYSDSKVANTSVNALDVDNIKDYEELKILQATLKDGANVNDITAQIESGEFGNSQNTDMLRNYLDSSIKRISSMPHANPVGDMETFTYDYHDPNYTATKQPHQGIDFAYYGEIYATTGGVVVDIESRWSQIPLHLSNYNRYSAGNYVLIKDSSKNQHFYAHLAIVSVSPGDIILPGRVIGFSGNTGFSRGIHLHYEIQDASGDWFNQSHSINPNTYLGLFK